MKVLDEMAAIAISRSELLDGDSKSSEIEKAGICIALHNSLLTNAELVKRLKTFEDLMADNVQY